MDNLGQDTTAILIERQCAKNFERHICYECARTIIAFAITMLLILLLCYISVLFIYFFSELTHSIQIPRWVL